MIFFYQLLTFTFLGFAIAYFLGKKRWIGFWWSLFFCISLSPLLGYIITIFSSKIDEKPFTSSVIQVWGWLLIPIGVLSGIGTLTALFVEDIKVVPEAIIYGFMVSLGVIGFGIYIILSGRGVVFNKKYKSLKAEKEKDSH